MAITISQADLLEIYKAEGGGKSSWHCGAPINLRISDRCLLSKQHYKYEPSLIDNFGGISQTERSLHFLHPLILNLAFLSIYMNKEWMYYFSNAKTVHFMSLRRRICRQEEKFRQFGVTFQLLTQSAPKCFAPPDLSMFCFCSTTLIIHWTAYPLSLCNWNSSALYFITPFRNNHITKKIYLREAVIYVLADFLR